MAMIEKDIDVEVPVRMAYNQWTQFEEFPRFMEGIERVEQLDQNRLHWVAKVGTRRKEWDAKIVEQTPDQRIAWRSEDGDENAGIVTFRPVSEDQTKVSLRMEYKPEGIVENVGEAVGIVSRRVEGDLKRFKEFIETRGEETGEWRGEIHNN